MCYYGSIKKKQKTYSPEGWQQLEDCGHPFYIQRDKTEVLIITRRVAVVNKNKKRALGEIRVLSFVEELC